MICSVWLTSCVSTTSENKPASRIPAPDMYDSNGDIAVKYTPAGEQFIPDEDGVYMPWWYWQNVFNYIVITQELAE